MTKTDKIPLIPIFSFSQKNFSPIQRILYPYYDALYVPINAYELESPPLQYPSLHKPEIVLVDLISLWEGSTKAINYIRQILPHSNQILIHQYQSVDLQLELHNPFVVAQYRPDELASELVPCLSKLFVL
ncbi:MAG: hypothetical protein AAF927_15980 [Bacteroidota bacterium]